MSTGPNLKQKGYSESGPSQTISLSGIKDISTTNPIRDNDILLYDANDKVWKNTEISLDIFLDIEFVPPLEDCQVLKYDVMLGAFTNEFLKITDLLGICTSNSPSVGTVLTWSGTCWTDSFPAGSTLASLGDVDLTSLQNNDYLVYDSASGVWVNQQFAISTISDFCVESPQDGQFLIYDTASGCWKNEVLTLDKISELNVSSATEGDIISFDGTEWVTKPFGTLIAGTGITLSPPDGNLLNSDIMITSTGGGGGASTIQQAYDNSTDPILILSSSVGPFAIRDNSTPLTDSLFFISSNNDATDYLFVSRSNISGLGATRPTSTDNFLFGSGTSVTGNSNIIIGENSSASDNNILLGNNNNSSNVGNIILSTRSTITMTGSDSVFLAGTASDGTFNESDRFYKFFKNGELFFTNTYNERGPDFTKANKLLWGANETKTTTGSEASSAFSTQLPIGQSDGIFMTVTLFGVQTGGAGSIGTSWGYKYLYTAYNSGGTVTVSTSEPSQGVEPFGKSLNFGDPLNVIASGENLQFILNTSAVLTTEEIQWILTLEGTFNRFG